MPESAGVGVCVLAGVLVMDGNADGVCEGVILATVLFGVGVRVLAGVLVMDGNADGEVVVDDVRVDEAGVNNKVASVLN